jgi:sugar phosphate isomerase/epimerase
MSDGGVTMAKALTTSRRQFLAYGAALAGSAAAGAAAAAEPVPPKADWQIVIFSKVHHNEMGLTYEETAEAVAASGFDGIDCPVRPGGQVLPERVADDLPRLAEILAKRGLRLCKVTTHITGTDSAHAERLLKTAAGMGIRQYRLGVFPIARTPSPYDQIKEITARLKDLAAMNRAIGVCGLLQNHIGGSVGNEVWQIYEIARNFDPAELALAWDIGHATAALGDGWHAVLQLTRSHFGVAYVKDYDRQTKEWVPLGKGSIDKRYFSAIKGFGYHGLVSLHCEYQVPGSSRAETRANLIAGMTRDCALVRRWIADA